MKISRLIFLLLLGWLLVANVYAEDPLPSESLTVLPRVDAHTTALLTDAPEDTPQLDENSILLPPVVPELPVDQIVFHANETLADKDLLDTIPIRLGDKLSPALLKESVEALYRREIFKNVEVNLLPHENSVGIEFFLTPTLFVAEINFFGNSIFDKKQLRRLSGIQLRDELLTSNLVEAKKRIIEGYRREGYFSPQVSAELSERFVAPQVIVEFKVDEGPPGRIESVQILGELPSELAWLPQKAERRALDAIASEENIKTFRRELLSAVRKEGYLQASVDLKDLSISPETGRVTLIAQLKIHEPVSLVFNGNTIFSPDDLLAPLKLETRTVPFTPSAIKNLCRQIERMYQAEGYLYARVTPERQPRIENRRVYEINIDEGKRVRISKIRFEGVSAFSETELSGLMVTRPAGKLPVRIWRRGYLLTEALSSDLGAIELLYRDAGYFNAEVTYELLPVPGEDALELVIKVNEGEMQQIKNVELEWKNLPTGIDSSELLSLAASLKTGEPFSAPAIRVEQKRLADLVIARGYPNATVDAALNREEGDVRFVIEPGLKVRIGLVHIAGNTSIADRLIKRELSFNSGDIFLPDKLRESEQALYALGYFKSASITPTDGALDTAVEDLTVRLEERDTGSVDLGTILSTEDGAHVFGELGQRNLGGEGEAIVLGVDGFIRNGNHILDAGNARVGFTEPRVLSSDLDWYTEGFAQYSNELLDLYSYDRVGVSTSLRSRREEVLKTSFGYSTYHERVYDAPSDIILGENDSGSTVYSFLSLQLDWDKRDSGFNPRSGHRTLFQTRVNSKILGSDVDLYALLLQESVYFPLSTNWVWANNLKGNLLRGFNDTEVIPLSQRIALGGRNSLRGFSLNAVGPRGENGNIVGGDSSLTLNSELQYDLTESMIGVLFVDVGQAFLHSEGTFTGDSLGIEDLRYSPGIGIRYRTPIGPITSDLGFNPDREHGERWGRLFLSIGGAF